MKRLLSFAAVLVSPSPAGDQDKLQVFKAFV